MGTTQQVLLASASAFAPSDIVGLQLWFKADSLALADNDPVGTWEDSAGTNDATQAVAGSKPTFKENIFGALPAVRGDGADGLTLASPVTFPGAYTLYAVGARAASQIWIPVGAAADASSLLIFSDNNIYAISSGVTVSAAYTGATENIITRFHRSAVGATNKFRATGMSEVNVGVVGSINVNELLERTFAGQFSTGDFAEILLWNADLTADQMLSVESYLARWGIAF